MHAHIQSIMRATQSIQEIESAFWGSRHPAWSSVERSSTGSVGSMAYRHGLVAPIATELLVGRSGELRFCWTVQVDWMAPERPQHEFVSSLTMRAGDIERQILVDYVRLNGETASLRRDTTPEDVSRDMDALTLWRRRYHAAVALLGIELPSTFERPKRPVETFSESRPIYVKLKSFAAELGSLALDELCGAPLPQGC